MTTTANSPSAPPLAILDAMVKLKPLAPRALKGISTALEAFRVVRPTGVRGRLRWVAAVMIAVPTRRGNCLQLCRDIRRIAREWQEP